MLQTNASNALSDNPKCYTENNVTLQNPPKPAPSNDCHGVTDENSGEEGNEDVPHTQVVI